MENLHNQIPSTEVRICTSGDHTTYSIEGTVQLTAWVGFQARQGPYNAAGNSGAGDGTVQMMVGEYASAEALLSITPEHVQAYGYTIKNQEAIRKNILNHLLVHYKALREEYGYEDEAFMPPVKATAQFKDLIGLSRIHLMDVAKEGIAYVGYEFGCTWDEEHGLGVMTHKDRVIEIGGADTAFDQWVAENDMDPVAAAALLDEHKDAHHTRYKKPWWKFW